MGGKNPMGCGAKCCRITLVSLNIIFLLCGIAFLVLGGIFRFGSDELKDEAETSLKEVEVGEYNLYDLSTNLAIMFMVSGGVMIIFAGLGFVGACCMSQCALVLYSILIFLCFALELAGVILFFVMRNEFEDGVRDGLKKSIEQANNSTIADVKAAHQSSLEYMFREMDCCHVSLVRLDSYGDATGTCNVSEEAYGKDCYDALKEWIEKYQMAFIAIGIAVAAVELLLIICACVLCRAIRREDRYV